MLVMSERSYFQSLQVQFFAKKRDAIQCVMILNNHNYKVTIFSYFITLHRIASTTRPLPAITPKSCIICSQHRQYCDAGQFTLYRSASLRPIFAGSMASPSGQIEEPAQAKHFNKRA
jgi:hypothetical protein